MFFANYHLLKGGITAAGETVHWADGIRIDRLTFDWSKDTAPDEIAFTWEFPDTDIAGRWIYSAPHEHRKPPEWASEITNRSNLAAPIYAYLSENGTNRHTFALSETVLPVLSHSGVVEETGAIQNRIYIRLSELGDVTHYELKVYRDTRPLPLYKVLGDISAWWEAAHPPLPVPSACYQPLYSTWYNFHKYLTADGVLSECEKAAQMGFQTVIIDDGWETHDFARDFRYAGDWHLATDKIPDMRALSCKVHALGMKILLWFSVPLLGTESEIYRKWKETSLSYSALCHTGTLDPRYPALRAHMKNAYVKALKEWNLDGLKLDFIDFPHESEAFPFKEGMDEVSVGVAMEKMLFEIVSALKEVKEDVMIEFRQPYHGPVMRQFCNMIRVGDCPYDYITNRISVADLRMLSGTTAIHSDMLMWDPSSTPESAARQILNVLFGVLQYSMKLGDLPDSHIKMSNFWVRFMKEHQDLLLKAPLITERPLQFYPALRTERSGETVVAVYMDHYMINLNSDFRKIMLVNATHQSEVLLNLSHEKEARILLQNCMGEVVKDDVIVIPAGISMLPVPESGLCTIQ